MTLIESNSWLDSQQSLRVAAQNHLAALLWDTHVLQALQHLGDRADLVRIVAAGKNLAGAGKAYGQFQSARIEVHGIEVKLFEIGTWRPRYVFAAVGKGFITTVKPLGQIWNSAAQVSKHPLDVGKALSYAAKNQAGGGK